jgi:tetratricopeptide (TPR) repeat protein
MSVLLVPFLLALVFAPAPFPNRPDLREIDATSRDADASFEAASRANQRLLLDVDLSPDARTKLQRQHRLALERAADQYARLARMVEALKTPSAPLKQQATLADFKAAKCRFNLGQYEKALAIYERLIHNHVGKVEELDALGGSVSCHAAMGKEDKAKQRLLQIEKAIKRVPAEVRDPWLKWLENAKKQSEDAD